MIIAKTPFRISFVGGGPYMKSFYKFHDGVDKKLLKLKKLKFNFECADTNIIYHDKINAN